MAAELLDPCWSSHDGLSSGKFWREETFLQLWDCKIFCKVERRLWEPGEYKQPRTVQTTHLMSLCFSL